jgi:hypothetical protein
VTGITPERDRCHANGEKPKSGCPPEAGSLNPCSSGGEFGAGLRERRFDPEEIQDDAAIAPVRKSENVGAAFAEPIVMNAVESDGQSLGRIANAGRNLIVSEAEELAASEPMECRRTCGIRALWMKVLAERKIGYGLAVRRVLVVLDRRKSFPLLFQPGDGGPQPCLNGFFNLVLVAPTVEIVKCFT